MVRLYALKLTASKREPTAVEKGEISPRLFSPGCRLVPRLARASINSKRQQATASNGKQQRATPLYGPAGLRPPTHQAPTLTDLITPSDNAPCTNPDLQRTDFPCNNLPYQHQIAKPSTQKCQVIKRRQTPPLHSSLRPFCNY